MAGNGKKSARELLEEIEKSLDQAEQLRRDRKAKEEIEKQIRKAEEDLSTFHKRSKIRP